MQSIDREELQRLLTKAVIKSRIKRDLRFVPEEIMDWEDRDFLAVMNRSKSTGVLVVPLSVSYVIPFQLQARAANKVGRVEAIICDFCATWQRGSNSAVITFEHDKSSTSFLCCADLDCSLHVRGNTKAALLSRTQLREDITLERRIERLQQRLEKILPSVYVNPLI